MNPLLKILLAGFLISFVSTLPLATMNVAAMQISMTEGILPAVYYSSGGFVVEIIYVRLSLFAFSWIQKQKKLFTFLNYFALIVMVVLSAAAFYAAFHPSVEKNAILNSKMPKFLLGMMMCAMSPAQIPFWLGWSTALFSKNILQPRSNYYNLYILGIGLGTFTADCCFIFGGQLVGPLIKDNYDIMNMVIGVVFAISALMQLYKILKKKNNVEDWQAPPKVEELS
jgi:threonine/homoserine/homoserine lactone efflux protein